MKRNVKLYGTLAIDSGVDELQLDVNHSRMLFRALEHRVPNFRKITRAYPELVVIGTKKGETNQPQIVPTNDPLRPFEDADTIHVLPKTEGDISEAVYALVELGLSYAAAYAVVIVGVVALMYGVSTLAQSLAPKPSTGSTPSDNSFIFSGPTNATSQGGPVPIVYGTCLVGSTIIASNYLSIDVPIGTTANTYIPGDFR
jgi:predicted phage tail protein